jgi:hypothetical protein
MDSSVDLKPTDMIAGDRRADRRYDIRLDLRWKLVRRRRVLDSGTGYTVDLSSGGILIDAGRHLPAGLNIELFIAWPVLLHNVAAMQLVVSGRIVRADRSQIAVRMVQHEFRTAAVLPEHRALTPAGSRAPFLISNAALNLRIES